MTRKKKWYALSGGERKVVQFTDQEWGKITRFISLPDEVRLELGEYVGLYQLYKASHHGRPTPAETARELESIRRIALRLKEAYRTMGTDAAYTLMEVMPGRHRLEAFRALGGLVEQLGGIADGLAMARDHVKKKRKNPGKDAGDIDWFMRQIDVIQHRYTNEYITRTKPQIDYVVAVFAVADPEVALGTIEAAIKRRIKDRDAMSLDKSHGTISPQKKPQLSTAYW